MNLNECQLCPVSGDKFSSSFFSRARLWAGSNVIAEQQGHGSYLQHICFFGIADMQAGTDFAITAWANSSTSTKGLVAIRIG